MINDLKVVAPPMLNTLIIALVAPEQMLTARERGSTLKPRICPLDLTSNLHFVTLAHFQTNMD